MANGAPMELPLAGAKSAGDQVPWHFFRFSLSLSLASALQEVDAPRLLRDGSDSTGLRGAASGGVVTRAGASASGKREGISRASHESWRSLGWCGGAVSVCMWHLPRWSVWQCAASWASRASHGCICFCLGLAPGACLSHLALPVYAYLACAGLLAQLSLLLQTFESCALLQRRGCNGRRCNVSEQPNMLLRLGARAHAAKVTPWLVQAVMWEFRGCA